MGGKIHSYACVDCFALLCTAVQLEWGFVQHRGAMILEVVDLGRVRCSWEPWRKPIYNNKSRINCMKESIFSFILRKWRKELLYALTAGGKVK